MGKQRTVEFPGGRVVTFQSETARQLAQSMARLGRRKRKPAEACGHVRVCRDRKTGRFVRSKR